MLGIHQDAVTGRNAIQKFRNNAVLGILQTTKPMLLSGALQFPPSSTHMENSHHQQGRLHKSPTSSGHKKINLVLKYSANEVSFFLIQP
jgi:hypothetical protein